MRTLPKEDNLIVRLTYQFAVEIIEYCEELESKRKYVLSRQLMRAATGIGANVHEAQNAESKLDFIHKMKIAAKEAEETDYWLELCKLAAGYPDPGSLCKQHRVITLVLNKIIGSAKRKSLMPV